MHKISITGILLSATLVGLGLAQAVKKPSADSTCVAGPKEKCPDAKDYARIKAYFDKYMNPPPPPKAPQDETDIVNGIFVRLNQNPPAGMQFDTKRFLYVEKAEDKKPEAAPSK